MFKFSTMVLSSTSSYFALANPQSEATLACFGEILYAGNDYNSVLIPAYDCCNT